jgi:hypothetical protein
MKAILLLPALLLLTTFSAAGDGHLTLVVSPLMSFAPSSLTIRTRLVPHTDNRSLDIVAESTDFYRSSRIPLEGDHAPAVITVQFRDLPTGDYQIYSVLTDASGGQRAIAQQRVRVIASGGE